MAAPTFLDRALGGRLWRDRGFLLLWTGQAVSEAGTQVTALALPSVAILVLPAGADPAHRPGRGQQQAGGEQVRGAARGSRARRLPDPGHRRSRVALGGRRLLRHLGGLALRDPQAGAGAAAGDRRRGVGLLA